MSIKFKKTYTLSYESIDLISEKIQSFCAEIGIDKREIARNRLSAEEYLLGWYDEVKDLVASGEAENGGERLMAEIRAGGEQAGDFKDGNEQATGEFKEDSEQADDDFFTENEDELARAEIRNAATIINSKSSINEKFTAEDLLKVTLVCGKSLNKYFFRIEKRGESQKPLADSTDVGAFSESVLLGLDLKPQYTYKNNTRFLTYKLSKKKKNQLVVIAEVIVAAVIVGLALNGFLPASASEVLLNGIVSPVYDMLFRLLSCISGPLVLLSVMWGVYGIGDTTMLGKIGKRLIFSFIGLVFLISAATSVTFPIFGNSFTGGNSQTSQLGALLQMILDIVPGNLVEPFANGNTLQIIFLAFLVGIAMLFLGKKVTVVAEVVEQINYIVQFLLDLISRLIPFFIFVIVVRMILSGTFSVLSSLWKLVIVFAAMSVAVSVVITAFTCIKFKVSPAKILRKSLPTFMISITTASSAAAFGSNMETCEKRFGIEPAITSFGIPLGMVMCKTSSAVYFMTMSFFYCNIYGVEASISWIIMAVIVSGLLAVATPPIPGGGVIAYTVLFSQLGIPNEAIAIALSIDIVFDYMITAINMYNLPLVLLNIANRVGMQDSEILRK